MVSYGTQYQNGGFDMKKIYFLMFIIFIIAALLPACQPTPEDVVVRNKGNDVLLGMIRNGSTDGKHEGFVSAHRVSERFANEKLRVFPVRHQ